MTDKLCECGCGQKIKYERRFVNGHNSRGKNHPMYGKKHTIISKEKNRQSNLNRNLSDDARKRMNEVNIGKKHTEETKQKMSKSHKGKKRSDETKKKIKEGNKGKKRSDETKKKISKARKGTKHTEEAKRKMGRKGLKRSKETIEKIRKARIGTKHSSETRKKLRLAYLRNLEKRINKGSQLSPVYNPEACKLIDEYGKEYGYNFQHAENGGEFYIKELGYFVDGFDKENNVVIEVDELQHFNSDGTLREKDIQRQKEIEKYLKCKFIRLRI